MSDIPLARIQATAEPGRRARKRRLTTDHLADTAWALFNEQGFESVTMEAIAEAADVAKGTLYKHFPVKEALLRHRFHRELADELPAVLDELAALPTVAERLHVFFRHTANWSVARRAHLGHYVRFRLGEVGTPDALAPDRHSGLGDLFAGLVAAGQRSGEFRSTHDPLQVAHYLQFLHLATLLRWLNMPGLDLAAAFDSMLDLFLKGLEAAP